MTTGENGNNLTIEAGQFESGTEGNGGSLTLKGGSGDSGDGSGGDLILQPGAGETAGVLQIKGSNFLLDSTSAKLAFRSAIGAGTGTYDNGSIIKTNTIQTHATAILNIYGSNGTTPYPVNITGGSETGDTGSGAGVNIAGGTSGGDGGNGGDVTIQGGSGETTNGKVILGGSDTLQIDVNSTLTAIDSTVTGTTNVGKITLTENTFLTAASSFTLGDVHKGATVLLQNTGSINITVPSQVAGYTTTFIAETNNPVSFITGTGLSGLNSFNGASDIAGIYGQAQVIYKSAEYAFLGGNIV